MITVNKPWLSHYDVGVPAEIQIPDISLVTLFKQAVEKYGNKECIIYGQDSLTYHEIDDLSNRVARYLVSIGIEKGDRVGILLPNIPAFVMSYYGILKAGGVVMALNPGYRPIEIQNLVAESGIKALVLPFSDYEEIKEIRAHTQIDHFVVLGGEPSSLSAKDLTWEALLKEFMAYESIDVEIFPNDPAVFQYSGGTTGTPKCAIGLHKNLVANVYQFDHWLVNTEAGKETVLVAIPVYHVYGMVLGMNLAVKMGARMVLISNPGDLEQLLEAIQAYRATIFPGVPNLYAAINRHPAVQAGEFDLSSIKACISGSTTLPETVKMAFEALTNGHLVEGYGLSEAPTATHCNPILGENRVGSIGLPLPNVDCRVVDLETGSKILAPGEVGELIVRGPQVMAGYHDRPDETEKALRNGWLFTGDIVRMDEDGYFYIVDRKKDVIKVGGFQVWPNEVEAVIRQHPKVLDVAVAGVRDKEGAESAKAWVVLKEGEKSTSGEIQAFCELFLTRYKIPRFITFRDSLPRTRVGKVLRRVLVSEEDPE